MARRPFILGSTGSIGTQALDIVGRLGRPGAGRPVRGEPWETLVEQARTHGVGRVRWPTRRPPSARRRRGRTARLSGPEGLVKLVADSGAELVLNALVGAAGLGPTVATLGEGIDLALANKESLVVGGEL